MWGPFENVKLLYFLLKIQIWNGCNMVNIAGNPIKDINVNLSFLSSRWKVGECTPQRLEKFLTSYLSSGSKVVEYTPQAGYQVEIWENLLFHVLSNDACKFAINIFPIMWGPFENVNLLYFLLKIQIWNGCNVVNIAGNPIKDINVNLSFLSSRWKVVEWKPPPPRDWKNFKLHFWVQDQKLWNIPTPHPNPRWVSGGNLGKSTFPYTIQWCMQICHKPFSHHVKAIWKC